MLKSYWLGNIKKKNFLSGLQLPTRWDDVCVRLCRAASTKTCHVVLDDGVRKYRKQLNGQIGGNLEQWLWRPLEVRQVSNSPILSHSHVCFLTTPCPHSLNTMPKACKAHIFCIFQALYLCLWSSEVDGQVERSPIERSMLMVGTNDKCGFSSLGSNSYL